MTTIDSMLELANDLQNNEKLGDSINVYRKILDDYTTGDETDNWIYILVGGVYLELQENDKALKCYKTATELSPEDEVASIGLYVALNELERDEEAFQELTRYLKICRADLYKGFLEELLAELEEGHMTDYEKEIRYFARVNGVLLSSSNEASDEDDGFE